MNLKAKIAKLQKILRPKRKIRIIMSEDDITDEENVIWVIFKI